MRYSFALNEYLAVDQGPLRSIFVGHKVELCEPSVMASVSLLPEFGVAMSHGVEAVLKYYTEHLTGKNERYGDDY